MCQVTSLWKLIIIVVFVAIVEYAYLFLHLY
nr:small membrane protein YkgR [Escherichia coli]